MNRASSFAERLQLGFAVIHGEEKELDSEKDDGRASPPPTRITSVDVHDLPGKLSCPLFLLNTQNYS